MRAARYIGVGIATLGVAAVAAAPVSAHPVNLKHTVFLAKLRYQPQAANGVNGEYVKLTNGRDYYVNLRGWTLSERYSSRVFTFPDKWLAPGASVWLYSGMGHDNGANLYWNSRMSIWHNSGDTAQLRNASATLVDTLKWKDAGISHNTNGTD